MKFNVAQLLKSVTGTTREYAVDAVMPSIDDVPVVSNVAGKAKFTRTPTGILVQADLDLTVKLNCSRCLEEMAAPLHLHFEEEYKPSVDIVTGAELPAPEDANVFTIDANHILDLAPAVREYALLELPMHPLCSEVCKGLCPECGQNLNRGKCNCPATPGDSRLAALAKLLEEKKED